MKALLLRVFEAEVRRWLRERIDKERRTLAQRSARLGLLFGYALLALGLLTGISWLRAAPAADVTSTAQQYAGAPPELLRRYDLALAHLKDDGCMAAQEEVRVARSLLEAYEH